MAVAQIWQRLPALAEFTLRDLVLRLVLLLISWQVLSSLAFAVYNLYLHPLRSFPGPRLWVAFPIIRIYYLMRGKLDYKLRDLHEQYGDVVRSAPQILSFTAASAWKDIYGYGHRELPKGIVQGSGFDEDQLIAAPGASHARMRRAMGPAFSDKALGQQEAVIMEYVDLLVQRLHETSRSGKPTDMVQWYNFTTFDAIADLAYGKSLGGLSEGTTNEWIKNIRRLFQVFPLILIAMQFPLLSIILKIHAGSKIRNAQASHKKYCTEMTMERIHRKGQPDRGDFMDYMMRSQDEKSRMSQTELVANSDLLMIAGSETTATLLSGITFWLLKTPGALKRVVEEVRSEFESDADITFRTATDKLPYMLACLDECLRIYPPVPSAFVRHCPPGAPTPICGLQVPAGVSDMPQKSERLTTIR